MDAGALGNTAVPGAEPATDERSRKLVTLASLIGTTVEWYDFFIYGTITGLVFNKQFFPSDDVLVSTALAYTVYAVAVCSLIISSADSPVCSHTRAMSTIASAASRCSS